MNSFSQLSDVNSSNGFNKNTWEAGQMKGRQREKERERGVGLQNRSSLRGFFI